jgi:RND superfamily putative drug exporter
MATEQATRKTTEHPRDEAVAAETARKTTTPAAWTARAARRAAAHRRTAVLGWFAFVLVAFAVGSAAGVVYLKDEEFGIGDSHGAENLLAREFPTERATEEVLIQSRHGQLGRAELRATSNELVARLGRVPAVAAVESPLKPANAGQVSRDGRSALVTFQITGDPDTAQERVGPALAATAAVQRSHPELRIGQVGDASATKAVSDRIADDFQRAEVTSLPVTLVILVLAFGALVAAGIPLLLGLTAVMAALGLTALFSHQLHVHESINSVILLIGLAVGIDYSLFYLRRYRAERARHRSPAAALEIAATTSGRAVLVSGLTVMAAMSGMFLMGTRIFQGFGVGTVLVVAIALIGSLTVLPAIISKLGDRIDRGRIPFLRRLATHDGESRLWGTIIGAVLRRPVVWGVLATALLVALAIPALRLHTANSGVQGLPHDLPIMQVYDRAEKAFPGQPQPAIVAVSAPDVTAPHVTAGIDALKRAALATGQMQDPITVDISASRRAARVRIPLAGEGTDAASNRALDALRGTVIPSTIGRVDGAKAHVTGLTAGSRDFNDSMKSHAPIVFAFVLGLAFVLLLITFRSIVIPLKAIVLNLLSVGAAYGVLVLVFQDGRFESLLGFQSFGGVTDWLPLFLFVVLFGLSMDYHVLILSRVREAHDAGMPTKRAVDYGIRATASVVTSAAIVMVAVFAIFATLATLDFKMMGVGLAVAVLLDATIVRAVLLPASMSLLGDWNWYLPRWLQWLPQPRGEAVATATETELERPGLGGTAMNVTSSKEGLG